jgi:hypothetical protein
MTTTLSTRIAAGVTAEYLLDLTRDAAAPRSRAVASTRGRGAAHPPARRPATALTYASRRARLGATRGGSSGCLG